MGGIGGWVSWEGAPVDPRLGRRMLAPIRHRGPDGLDWEARGTVGLGRARLALRRRGERAFPIWSEPGPLGLAADARLFHRAELAAELGLGDAGGPGGGPDLPDEALILAAYRRWGEELAERLDGDFAFALWDGARRRLLLARSPCGARPLFYRSEPARLLFASEPKQILCLPGVETRPDDLVVGEYLFDKFEEMRRTFFEGIRRLEAGHVAVAAGAAPRPRRYWRPDPGLAPASGAAGGHLEVFRRALVRSVAERLETEFPVVAHLSGGLDSSSIVAVAAGLVRDGVPSFETVACRFDGLPCDEGAYIAAVARRSPFPHREVRPLERDSLDGLTEDLWQLDSPYADLQRSQFEAISERAERLGARTALTGVGGDELLQETFYLRDLARRGRFGRLVAEAWRGDRLGAMSTTALLADALKEIVPPAVKKAGKRLLRRQGWRPPDWVAPEFARFFLGCPEPPPPPRGGFPTLTQEYAFRFLHHPRVLWGLEALEARSAYRGIVPQHPFCDRRLAETVLAIPFDCRRPRGRWKRLLRDGLADALPPEVRERKGKAVFDAFSLAVLARHRAALAERVLDGGEWRAAPYVRRAAVERLFARSELDLADTLTLWQVSCLELWLRQLVRYTSSARENP